MPYHVDQSGKIESKGDTVLALSNAREYAIRIPAEEKIAATSSMEQRFSALRRRLIYIRLFAAALYHLLRELPQGETVTIDIEYTGHSQDIKAMLFNWLRQDGRDLAADDIVFWSIGKKSRAHKKALTVYQAGRRPTEY